MDFVKIERKIELTLLIAFLIVIPTQLGKHWWPQWATVVGLRVDFLAPTWWLIDVIVTGLMIFKKNWKGFFTKGLAIWVVFALLNILVAENKWVAGYRWLRIWQWWWMVRLLIKEKKTIKKYLVWVIEGWIVTEVLLGVAQVVNGGSLQGIFYWLGERRFNFNTLGIAQWSVAGNGLVRAYGTFSHPNSLAGFLLVALMLWQWWWQKNKPKNWVNKLVYWMVVWFGVVGVVISGSRLVWVVGIGILMFNLNFWKHKAWGKILAGGGLIIVVLMLISQNYMIKDWVGGWDSQGVAKRAVLNLAALEMVKDNPLLGVGAGNYIVVVPKYLENSYFYWLQPVHNIFLLVLSELGIVGVIGIIMILKRMKWRKEWWMVVAVIVITGMGDHYWLTLVQNWWMMGLVIALMQKKLVK